MKISEVGLNLIKKFEGCRLVAYKDSGGTWTIGYGHTSGVTSGQTITQAQADAFLVEDCASAETAVNKYQSKYNFNQNQYDALVSFAFNIGSIDKLTVNGTRTITQISEKIPAYCNCAGQKLQGLVNRRAAEKELFDTPVNGEASTAQTTVTTGNEIVKAGQTHANNFVGAGLTVDGIRGTETKKAGIKVLQTGLNLTYKTGLVVDGVAGTKTNAALAGKSVKKGDTNHLVTALEILLMLKCYSPGGVENPGVFGNGLDAAVRQYQKENGLTVDGIAGEKTFKSLIG